MNTLDKNLRGHLERTIQQAREIAEQAASASLEHLGVETSNAYRHLSDEERDLRRRLRAHGRQLGDEKAGDDTQQLGRLIEEIAYEHWHRMLFARFLAENSLLMYGDEDPVDIDLDMCQELLDDGEEDYSSVWEFAAHLAAKMLPQIFRLESPVFELKFAANYQIKLEDLVSSLAQEVFASSDGLGWVYQYWQAKRKDEVNANEVKIGEREISAVTQLFTEPYMVSFLLDNSLGAWWADKILTAEDLRTATAEEELREKASRDGLPLSYLRFVQQDDIWTPAAGTFEKWPDDISGLKILDPCCGSGHFLVSILTMLIPMRLELEQISETEAIDSILKENLYGLELDKRCVELAAFAVALAAWKYEGYRQLPELHLACSGLSVAAEKRTWTALAPNRQNVRIAMDWMYDVFKDAPVLGSLIDPTHEKAAKLAGWEELSSVLNQALSSEQSDEEQEAAVAAKGLAKAADLLSQKYHLIATNVPYLSRGKQDEVLATYCAKHYPEAKNDIATVFLDRCLDLCHEGGSTSIVLPQNWLFLTSYKKFREKLLKRDTWNMLARMGPGAFQTITGEVVKAILITISSGGGTDSAKEDKQEMLFGEDQGGYHLLRGLDVSEQKKPADKAVELVRGDIKEVEQVKQLGNPDARLLLEVQNQNFQLLNVYTECYQGMRTGEKNRFIVKFWEIFNNFGVWEYFRNSNNSTSSFGGMHEVVLWENGNGRLHAYASERRAVLHDMHESGNKSWGEKGVAINQMRNLKATHYNGEKYDGNVSVIFPVNRKYLLPLWVFALLLNTILS